MHSVAKILYKGGTSLHNCTLSTKTKRAFPMVLSPQQSQSCSILRLEFLPPPSVTAQAMDTKEVLGVWGQWVYVQNNWGLQIRLNCNWGNPTFFFFFFFWPYNYFNCEYNRKETNEIGWLTYEYRA